MGEETAQRRKQREDTHRWGTACSGEGCQPESESSGGAAGPKWTEAMTQEEPASSVTATGEAAGVAAGEATGVAVDEAAGRVEAGDAGGVAGVEGGAAPRAANRGETRPVARGAPSKSGGGQREARGRPSPGVGKAVTSEGTC